MFKKIFSTIVLSSSLLITLLTFVDYIKAYIDYDDEQMFMIAMNMIMVVSVLVIFLILSAVLASVWTEEKKEIKDKQINDNNEFTL